MHTKLLKLMLIVCPFATLIFLPLEEKVFRYLRINYFKRPLPVAFVSWSPPRLFNGFLFAAYRLEWNKKEEKKPSNAKEEICKD